MRQALIPSDRDMDPNMVAVAELLMVTMVIIFFFFFQMFYNFHFPFSVLKG